MLQRLPALFALRYTVLWFCLCGMLLALVRVAEGDADWPVWLALLVCSGLGALGLQDMRQTHHAVLRNYPVIGHLRFLFEFIRPEMRQYFIEGDSEAMPFSRAQRSLVYQRAKGEPDNRPFGTQLDVGKQGYEWVNHSMAPTKLPTHDFRVWIGGSPGQPSASVAPCTQPYHASVFNISAMSFGSLSAAAIRALNAGAKAGGFYHDTGEGSISPYHREAGGDLVWSNERLLFRGLSAPLSVGRTVIFGDAEGQVHFLDRNDGKTLLRLPTDGSPVVGQPVLSGTTMLVVTRNGGLFAFRPE